MKENINQDNTDFMKETIKQRPINRRKLVRRTLLTAAMAGVFLRVGCFCVFFLPRGFGGSGYPLRPPPLCRKQYSGR